MKKLNILAAIIIILAIIPTCDMFDDKGRWNPNDPDYVPETDPEGPTTAYPVITPDGGTFSETQNPTLTCETEGASIMYTTDGVDPAPDEGIEISSGESVAITESVTLKAMACKDGYNDSSIVSAVFTITSPSALNPISNLQLFPGDTQVELTWANPSDSTFAGVIVLQSLSAITWEPTDGIVYNDEDEVVTGVTIKYKGASISYTDTGLTNNVTYHYVVFAYSNIQKYSAGNADSTIPGMPPGVWDTTDWDGSIWQD